MLNSTDSNTPRLIEAAGEVLTKFKFDGQEVHSSCGVMFQNKHFLFGGETNKRLVLKIKNCGLSNIGSTPFDHRAGACSSTDEAVILCFNVENKDNNDYKRCRQASSPNGPWTQLALSTYDHRYTSIATSPGNYLFNSDGSKLDKLAFYFLHELTILDP